MLMQRCKNWALRLSVNIVDWRNLRFEIRYVENWNEIYSIFRLYGSVLNLFFGRYIRLNLYPNIINEAEMNFLHLFWFYFIISCHSKRQIFITGGHYKRNRFTLINLESIQIMLLGELLHRFYVMIKNVFMK